VFFVKQNEHSQAHMFRRSCAQCFESSGCINYFHLPPKNTIFIYGHMQNCAGNLYCIITVKHCTSYVGPHNDLGTHSRLIVMLKAAAWHYSKDHHTWYDLTDPHLKQVIFSISIASIIRRSCQDTHLNFVHAVKWWSRCRDAHVLNFQICSI
jgi:hypothetical protein